MNFVLYIYYSNSTTMFTEYKNVINKQDSRMPIEINSSNKLINCDSCIQHATCLMNRNITFDIFTLKYHIL